MMTSPSGPMHPGRILHEQAMEPLGVSRNKLARDIDVPVGRISDIVAGKRGITEIDRPRPEPAPRRHVGADLALPDMPEPVSGLPGRGRGFSPADWAVRLNGGAARPEPQFEPQFEPGTEVGAEPEPQIETEPEIFGSDGPPENALGGAAERGDDDGSADADPEQAAESATLEIPDPDDWRSRLNLGQLIGRK